DQQRPELGVLQRLLDAAQPVAMQAAVVDPLLEIDPHDAQRRQGAAPVVTRVDVLGADFARLDVDLVHDGLLILGVGRRAARVGSDYRSYGPFRHARPERRTPVLDSLGPHVRPGSQGGGILARLARFPGRALALVVASLLALLAASTLLYAQPAPVASLEPLKLELDQIEATLGREGLGDDELSELRDRIAAARDDIRARSEAIEPQL